jgi:hypothetical protein
MQSSDFLFVSLNLAGGTHKVPAWVATIGHILFRNTALFGLTVLWYGETRLHELNICVSPNHMLKC